MMNTVIDNYHVALNVVSGLVTINNTHKAWIGDMEIFEEYKDDYPPKGDDNLKDKLELFKIVFDTNNQFSITISVYEASYYKGKGMVIYAENDAFPIFELRFPTYSFQK